MLYGSHVFALFFLSRIGLAPTPCKHRLLVNKTTHIVLLTSFWCLHRFHENAFRPTSVPKIACSTSVTETKKNG